MNRLLKSWVAAVILVMLLASPGIAGPMGSTPNWWKRTGTVISPNHSGDSLSVPGGITGNVVTISDPDITGHHAHTIVDGASTWTFNTGLSVGANNVDCNGIISTGNSGVFVNASAVNIRDAANTTYRSINCDSITAASAVFNTNADALYLGADANNDGVAETWNFRKNGTTVVAYFDATGNLFSTGTTGIKINNGGADGNATLLTVDLASDATLTWDNTNGKFVFNKPVGMTTKVTATTAATLTAGQIRNGSIFCTAAGTYVLPDISADTTVIGAVFYVISTTAAAVVVDTEAGNGDVIVLSGTTLDAGDKISSDSTAGAMCMFIVYNSTTYYAYPISGVWFDAGP